MRYLKLYENFITETEILQPEVEISNTTIDDVLKPGFFKNKNEEESFIDSKGIIHIKNWKQY